MVHQLNIFLLLFGALQGMLVSLFLLKNVRRHQSNIFLALFLVVVGLQLTFKVIAKSWLMANVHFFYDTSYYFPFLVAPLFYLFLRTRSTGILFSGRDAVHFVPFAFCVVNYFMCLQFGYSYRQLYHNDLFHPYPMAALQFVSFAVYSWLGWRFVTASTRGHVRTSLTRFIVLVLCCETIIIATLAFMYVYYGQFPDVRLLFTVLTLLIYWISYKIASQPDIFLPAETAPVVHLKFETTTKYAHSGLKTEEASRIAALLEDAMRTKMVYLQSDMSIEKLAGQLQISRHHVSQVLNEKFSQTYFDYINGYRLEEARARFANTRYAHFTIAGIALDSGFSSVSNFNEVFKKRYGMTPSKFRSQQSGKKMSA